MVKVVFGSLLTAVTTFQSSNRSKSALQWSRYGIDAKLWRLEAIGATILHLERKELRRHTLVALIHSLFLSIHSPLLHLVGWH